MITLSILSPVRAAFTDVTESVGIVGIERVDDRLSNAIDIVVRGGSPVIMDFNDDGWLDIYITRFGLSDVLFLNIAGNDERVFERVDNPLGGITNNGGNSAAWADFDNDGDKDFVVATVDERRYRMYLNEGEGVYREVAQERGVDHFIQVDHQGSSVCVGDINNDGYLDILIGEHGPDINDNTRFNHHALFLNQGVANPGYFTNVTEASGVVFSGGSILFFTPMMSDLDGDGWLDLAIIADNSTSKMFWNNGDGTFSNTTDTSGINLASNGMGAAIADLNGDGFLDMYVTNIAYYGSELNDVNMNHLYLNQGNRVFETDSIEAGVPLGGWGWGTNFFDFDNDRDLDLVMLNGTNFLTPENGTPGTVIAPMILWENVGGGAFEDVSDEEGVNSVGDGSGIVNFDYDNDGDLDIFVIHQNGNPVLLRNDTNEGKSWLRITLEGVLSNKDGIGSRIRVSGGTRIIEYNPSNAYLAQLEPLVHIGLGGAESVSSIEVAWPSGIVQVIENVTANQVLHIKEDVSAFFEMKSPFEHVTATFSQEDLEVGIDLEMDANFRIFDVMLEASENLSVWEFFAEDESVVSKEILENGKLRIRLEDPLQRTFESPTFFRVRLTLP